MVVGKRREQAAGWQAVPKVQMRRSKGPMRRRNSGSGNEKKTH